VRKTFVEVSTQVVNSNDKATILLGDIGAFGFRNLISQFPNRVFNLGILEQSMIGVGAGMASSGYIPTIHTIAPFLIDRAFEQIKVDFGYQTLPVNLVSVGASFDYSSLGCTHHGPEDVGILSQIPGVNFFIPGHAEEFRSQFLDNWNNGGINYFRLSESQNTSPVATNHGEPVIIKTGKLMTILVVGPLLDQVIEAVRDLDVEVLYVSSVLADHDLAIPTEISSKQVLIIEPYYSGFLLGKILDQISSLNVKISQIGVPKQFIRKYGTYREILKYTNLDTASIRLKVKELLLL
jgi:transketolase